MIAMYRNAKKLFKLFVLLLFLFYFAHCESAYFLYKIGQSRDTLTANKTMFRLERTRGSTCETAANKVITLGIMLVRIVLHVHPMPEIQEFELIEINSFIHGRISYKHVGFHYISYILQLKKGALEV